jgi:hypothetical protein
VGKAKTTRSKHSKANRAYLEYLISKWSSILLLESFSIIVEYSEKESDTGAAADVTTDLTYKRIYITVYPGVWEDTIPVEHVVRHELLHSIVAPLHLLVKYPQEENDSQLKSFYITQHESTVEHINNIIERIYEA